MKLIALFAVVLAGLAWAPPPKKQEAERRACVSIECPARVYLLPFEYDTLVPLMPEDMPNQYSISSCLRHARLDEIVGLLDKAKPGKFSDTCVRLSVTLPNSRRYFVDQAGGVWVDGKTYKLSESEFRYLKTTLYVGLPIFTLPD